MLGSMVKRSVCRTRGHEWMLVRTRLVDEVFDSGDETVEAARHCLRCGEVRPIRGPPEAVGRLFGDSPE